jgi:hypothetical protein
LVRYFGNAFEVGKCDGKFDVRARAMEAEQVFSWIPKSPGRKPEMKSECLLSFSEEGQRKFGALRMGLAFGIGLCGLAA